MNRQFTHYFCWALALAFGVSLAMTSSVSAQVPCGDGTGPSTERLCFEGVTNDKLHVKGCGRNNSQFPVTHFDLWLGVPGDRDDQRWGISFGDTRSDRRAGRIDGYNRKGNKAYLSFHGSARSFFESDVSGWVLDLCEATGLGVQDDVIKQFMVKLNKAGTRAKLKLRYQFRATLDGEDHTRKVKFRSNAVYHHSDR